ncbi:MAG: hypothetical protein WBC04_00075 [Candidatus Acidiferrales bacterium]
MGMTRIATGVFAFALLIGAAAGAGAQDSSSAQGDTNKPTTHKSTRTLTGCLQNGENPNEYLLTTKKGSTWEIKSDNVKLDQHVGHTVTITGVVSHTKMHGMKEDAKEEAKEHGMDKNATEHGHMTVTDLSMVSDTCQK